MEVAHNERSANDLLMQRSLFSALCTYASSYKTSPLENYTSQLLAWAVSNWPAFASAFGRLVLGPELERVVTGARATTQRYTTHGIIDLWLTVQLDDTRILEVLVENKVDAGIGLRTPAQPGADVVRAASGDNEVFGADETTQVDNYLAYAQGLAGKQEIVVV